MYKIGGGGESTPATIDRLGRGQHVARNRNKEEAKRKSSVCGQSAKLKSRRSRYEKKKRLEACRTRGKEKDRRENN